MRRVLLVRSVHRPTGVATAGELHWLLGLLRPDAIFLEHSAAAFSTFLDGSCGTLESAAVRRYRDLHPVELIPVDLEIQAAELKPKFDYMFDRILEASPRYCQLEYLNREHTERGGFAYLNSAANALAEYETQREMRATVEALGDPDLAELFGLWTRTNDLRELAMLNGVEAFARRTFFAKGVLLVGAAHAQPLFEKSQLPRGDGPSLVTWDFDWQHERASLEGGGTPGDHDPSTKLRY